MMAEAMLLSIGALSRAVGIPIETLRTWERRYGVPAARRTGAGHRRYPLAAVEQLRLVAQALQHGQPASVALRMDVPALQRLINATHHDAELQGAGAAPRPPALEVVERWLERVERYEGRAFERELRAAWAVDGGAAFIERRVGPFLLELGRRWQQGALNIAHEHFASERLRDFLVQHWKPLSDSATGACFVCATPAGEPHSLGLHLAALQLAMHNGRVVFLGADLPAHAIADAARHHAAEAVVLSASVWPQAALLARELAELRAQLPDAVNIVAGGCGAWPASAPGVIITRHFSDLVRFVLGE